MATAVTNGNSSSTKLKLDFTNFHNIINGQSRSTPQTRQGVNPATLENLPPVPLSRNDDIDAAVLAARTAFNTWKLTTVADRKQRLLDLADALFLLKDDFSQLLTAEQGKPVCASFPAVSRAQFLMR